MVATSIFKSVALLNDVQYSYRRSKDTHSSAFSFSSTPSASCGSGSLLLFLSSTKGRLNSIPKEAMTIRKSVNRSMENKQRKAFSFQPPSAFIASLRPLVVGEINAELLLEPARPTTLNKTVN